MLNCTRKNHCSADQFVPDFGLTATLRVGIVIRPKIRFYVTLLIITITMIQKKIVTFDRRQIVMGHRTSNVIYTFLMEFT